MFCSRIWEACHARVQPTQQQQQQQQCTSRLILPSQSSLCYVPHAELLQQALAVAAAYHEALFSGTIPAGHGRPAIIALLLPRSSNYVAASLGALAAGAAFLPLDPQWPAERLKHVLQSAQPDLLVHSNSTEALAGVAGTCLPCKGADTNQDPQHIGTAGAQSLPESSPAGVLLCELLSFDTACRMGQQLLLQRQATPQGPSRQDSPSPQLPAEHHLQRYLPFFCVLFTSGSTGKPVGVLCTEQGFLNRFEWMQQAHHQPLAHKGLVPLQPGHVVAFKTAVMFVDHLWELLAPFLSGADMLLLPEFPDHCPTNNHPHSAPHGSMLDSRADGRGSAVPAPGVSGGFMPLQPQAPAAALENGAKPLSEASACPQARAASPAGPTPSVLSSEADIQGASGSNLMLQPDNLVELLVQAKVTHLVAVPSILELWLPQLMQHRSHLSLQQLVSSGEGLTVALAAQLLEALPTGCCLVNLYGCTEVSADATCQVVTPQLLQCSSRWVPAGAPINSMAAAIVQPVRADTDSMPALQVPADSNPATAVTHTATEGQPEAGPQLQPKGGSCVEVAVSSLHPLPLGAVGEVVVTGVGLAAGYLPDAASAGGSAAVDETLGRSERVFQTAWVRGADVVSTDFSHPQATGQVGVVPQGSVEGFEAHQQQAEQPQHQIQLQPQQQPQQQAQQVSLAVGPRWAMQDFTLKPQKWFRTGDLGRLGGDGCLHILGRCSHHVKVRGVRVDILEVEHALMQHDLVRECAVAAWPHPQRPQDMLLVAYIAIRPQTQQPSHQPEQQQTDMESHAWQQQLQQHAASVLPPAAWPAAYVALTCLPRSPAGKVLRSQLPQPDSTVVQQQLPLLVRDAQLNPQLIHSQQTVQQLQEQSGQHSELAVMRAMLAAVPYGPSARASQPAQPLPRLDTTAPTAAAMQRDLKASAGAASSIGDTTAAASIGSSIAHQQQPFEPTQDFFTAWGGDSLAAAAVAAALGIDVRLVYAYPTARSLSAFLRHHPSGAGSAAAAAAGHAAGDDESDAWPHMASAGAASKQPAIAGMRPTAAEPGPKRPRLLSGAEAPLQQDGPVGDSQSAKRCTVSVAALISQAAAAVVIIAASRLLAWKLPDSSCVSRAQISTPAAAAAGGRQVSSSPTAAAAGAWKAPDSAGHLPHSQPQPEELKLHWRVPMGRCVDAAPLLLALTRPVPPGTSLVSPASSQGASAASSSAVAAVNEAAASHTATRSSCGEAVAAAAAPPSAAGVRVLFEAAGWEVVGLLAFACSHSGVVKCVEVHTGTQLWSTVLPARADLGLCLSRCATRLAVPAGDSQLYCLATTDGHTLGQVDCGAEVRAPPATDPWLGLWWLVTHGKELLVVEPYSLAVIARLSLPAAGSAAMTFASARTADEPAAEEQHLVLLALLDGSLLAVAVADLEQSTPPVAARQAPEQQLQQQHRPQQVALSVLWRVQGRGPIFSSPAADQQQGVVVVAAVDGTVQGLELSSGQQLWQVQLQGQVFADLLLLHHPMQCGQQGGTNAAGGRVHRCLTVVATKAGRAYGLDCRTGHQVFEVAVGGSGVSAAPAYVVGWEQVLEAAAGAGGGAAELQLPTDVCPDPGPAASPQQLVVCNTDGTMQVLQLDATGNLRVVQSVMLPGELFSSPVTLGCAIILGCRDDCLYCICRSAVFDPA